MKIRTRKVYNLLVEGYCRYLYIRISPESVQTNHCRNGGNMRFLMDANQFKAEASEIDEDTASIASYRFEIEQSTVYVIID